MGITVKEIAKIANCSATTVSKVLNNRNMNISVATRDKILRIAEENGYVPNFMAKSLRGQQTMNIGFIIPDITNPSFSKIAKGVEAAAKRRGYSIIFCDIDNDPQSFKHALSYLSSLMVDGVIVDYLSIPADNSLSLDNIPVVVVDRIVNENVNSRFPYAGMVYSDTKTAIKELTQIHISAGCRKIAYISSAPVSKFDRYYGYVEALEENGLIVDSNLQYWGRYDAESGSLGVEALIHSGIEFDGIVCGNDVLAIGAIHALQHNGFRVPDDVKVSGVGDISMVEYMSPSITTVSQFSFEMGEVAANMLIDNLSESKPLFSKQVDYQISRRESL